MQTLGFLFWAALAGARLSLALEMRTFFPLLLAVQSGLAAFRLLRRRFTTATVPWWGQAIAWTSALLPMALRIEAVSPVGWVLSVAGLLWVLWSMVTLGKSFGIAPADRGLVFTGPYRLVRHPMYAGELFSVLGSLLGNWNPWNGLLVLMLLISLIWRIQAEECLLFGYASYKKSTPWRLCPGLW